MERHRTGRRADLWVQVLLFDGFDPLDVIGPAETFAAPAHLGLAECRVELVSAVGPRAVRAGTAGLDLTAGALFDPACDILVVPGASGPIDGTGPGSVPALLAAAAQEHRQLLTEAVSSAQLTVATVCGGGALLGLAGVLDGRAATTHHLGLDLLDATGANVIDARIVDDGDIVSAGAVTSGIDLGIYLLERHLGPEVAIGVEKLFAFQRRGTAWLRPGRETA